MQIFSNSASGASRASCLNVRQQEFLGRLERVTLEVIVDQPVAEHVELDPANAESLMRADLGDLVIADR
jgi:hypothetical protein